MLESYGEIPGDVPHYTAPGGLAGYYPPVKGSRPEILFVLYKPFDNTTTSRRHVTLADIAYLPLMRCSQLLTWFVTARASQLACLCVHGPSPILIFIFQQYFFGLAVDIAQTIKNRAFNHTHNHILATKIVLRSRLRRRKKVLPFKRLALVQHQKKKSSVIEHRHLAERGLLSFLRLLRTFQLHTIKRNQANQAQP